VVANALKGISFQIHSRAKFEETSQIIRQQQANDSYALQH
jgi:hypothetical protein